MNTFPDLPFILTAGKALTEDQQQANLEFLAPFILAHQELFEMSHYHDWTKRDESGQPIHPYEHPCQTAHCIAGFAQLMGGPLARKLDPGFAGNLLLGTEAHEHFYEDNADALEYLSAIAGQS